MATNLKGFAINVMENILWAYAVAHHKEWSVNNYDEALAAISPDEMEDKIVHFVPELSDVGVLNVSVMKTAQLEKKYEKLFQDNLLMPIAVAKGIVLSVQSCTKYYGSMEDTAIQLIGTGVFDIDDLSPDEWEQLRLADLDVYLVAYRFWMYNEANEQHCDCCPENCGRKSGTCHLAGPCGQQHCWVTIHCNSNEDEYEDDGDPSDW